MTGIRLRPQSASFEFRVAGFEVNWNRQARSRHSQLALYVSMILSFAQTVSAQQSGTTVVKPAPESAAAASKQPRPSEEERRVPLTGSITGRVINDVGQPMVNAGIYVRGLNETGPGRAIGTDSEGKFQATSLGFGVYTVFASSPGYVNALDPFASDGSRRYYRIGDSVTLTMIKGGVVTGIVANPLGEPVVAVRVRAIRILESDGRPATPRRQSPERLTDDRGIYRLYGLEPGTYVIAVGGSGQYSYQVSPYDNDAPTYAPSATRDTAAKILVRSGEETGGVDVRYRALQGHAISGSVSGQPVSASQFFGVTISLVHTSTGAIEAQTFASIRNENRGFALYGVPDGEYEIAARGGFGNQEGASSAPRRVVVKGSDVTGLDLALSPLGSITGRLTVESGSQIDCVKRGNAPEETVIIARRSEQAAKKGGNNWPHPASPSVIEALSNEKGDFVLRNLDPGTYRIESRLPGSGWFVRSIVAGAATQKVSPATPASTSIAREGFTIKAGDRMSNLIVTIAEGAAAFRGRITAGEGEKLPSRLRVYLAPAERERAGDVLRFAEAPVDSDGTFAIGNIAPGRYRALVRPAASNDSEPPLPIALQEAGRTNLLREAETLGSAIELKPCQRITDYELRYVGSSPATSVNPSTRTLPQ